MFLGTHNHNLLEKGRIALPSKIRSELKNNKVILRISAEPCVVGFSEADWVENTREILSKSFFLSKEGREERRKIFADAEEIELDKQGRFVLPKFMAEKVGIKDKVTIIGVGDHFEIWETSVWDEYKGKLKI